MPRPHDTESDSFEVVELSRSVFLEIPEGIGIIVRQEARKEQVICKESPS